METYTKLAYPANRPKKAGYYDTDEGELYYTGRQWAYSEEEQNEFMIVKYFFSPIEPTSLPLLGVKEVLGKDLKVGMEVWEQSADNFMTIDESALHHRYEACSLSTFLIRTPIDRERLVEVIRQEIYGIVTALLKELGLNETK